MLPNPSKSIAVPNAQSVVVDLTESTDDETNSPPHTSKPSLPPNLASLDLMCQGIHLEFPDGQFPGGSYPFLLHDVKQLRWGYEYRQGRFYLRSNQCKGAASHGTKQCKACQHIDLDDGWLEGIRARLQNGVPRRAPNAYKPIGVLTAQNRQLRDSFDSKRLALFSAHVRLGVKSKKIDLHKRLVMAIEDGGVRRVDAVLRVSLRNGKGLGTVIDLVHKAAAGVYAPRDETEAEQALSLLMLRLGGTRLANIAHRALGLAEASTTRNRRPTEPLRISISNPTHEELEHNIQVSLEAGLFSTSKSEELAPATASLASRGYVLMIDEIKVEETVRWDPLTNNMLGLCREHGHLCSLEFRSAEDGDALCQAVKAGTVHLAKEVRHSTFQHNTMNLT